MQISRKVMASFGRAGGLAILAVVAMSGVLIGSNLSPAGAQSGGGEIHGCVSRYTSALRIVQNPGQCTATERPQSWNQQGPSGFLDIQQVRDTRVVTVADESADIAVHVDCPVGYRVTGGGAGLLFAAAPGIVPWYLENSSPGEKGDDLFPDSDGWFAKFSPVDGQNANGTYGFFAEAICVLTTS